MIRSSISISVLQADFESFYKSQSEIVNFSDKCEHIEVTASYLLDQVNHDVLFDMQLHKPEE